MRELRAIVTFIFLIVSFSVYAQDKVTDKDYYEFYNSIPQPYGARRFVLESEPMRFDISNSLFERKGDGSVFDTLFSKSDSNFLKEQISRAANFFWGPGMIDNAKVANKRDIDALFNNGVDAGWGAFNKIYKGDGFCQYSVPLFSADRALCVIECSYHCGGLCGEGDIFYYKKVNGNWKMVYRKVLWIS